MSTQRPDGERYVALSGGVGGAKLALGLAHLLGDRLTIIVNTGDDFEHLGLHISPDVDTAIYTLAGVVNPDTGWGRRDETWTFMAALQGLGGPSWFKLGDADLATHVERTRRLGAGETLTGITTHLAERFGVAARILPMCNERLRTVIETDAGALAFQDYFVRQQCRPSVRAIRFDGAQAAKPSPQVCAALADPALAGIVICPSNPWLSVDPILAVPGLPAALRASGAPVIAVSPIIAGRAVKGPTAKIMRELDLEPSAARIAGHYAGRIDGLLIDAEDGALADAIPIPVRSARTLMRSLDDKIGLARECIDFCAALQAKAKCPAQSAGGRL
ncbi:MAG TPA: 2-phospho-L-lactate transferase [Hyphomicrobiaceae bacterium]|nr:2-phospho-L-lactate transferase [Hyphomicrobiaceae bacterium]